MSKSLVNTHAGDDSDGKIWGLEGVNILFLLAGLVFSVGLALMLYRANPPAITLGIGSLPFVLTTIYVFALRQGRPRSFDNDLIETLAAGNGWTPPARQPINPLHRHENA
ncbi:MAG: hypothetical protein WA771_01975 [Chthoniobacterales bacterium]